MIPGMGVSEFLTGMLGASLIEVIASVAGLLCVILVVLRSMWCWPAGLVQVTLYAWIFFNVKLYSDFGLHIVYIFFQFYGWWNWSHGKLKENDTEIRILPLRPKTMVGWAALSLAGSVCLGALMGHYTDASFPYADAFTTVTSLVAQWLLSRRELMNWVFWIAVDVVAMWVYLQKGLYPTSLLYGIFLILCCVGVVSWLKEAKAQQTR